jgi:hypothetical protein
LNDLINEQHVRARTVKRYEKSTSSFQSTRPTYEANQLLIHFRDLFCYFKADVTSGGHHEMGVAAAGHYKCLRRILFLHSIRRHIKH